MTVNRLTLEDLDTIIPRGEKTASDYRLLVDLMEEEILTPHELELVISYRREVAMTYLSITLLMVVTNLFILWLAFQTLDIFAMICFISAIAFITYMALVTVKSFGSVKSAERLRVYCH